MRARVPTPRASGRIDLSPRDINLPGVISIGSYHYCAAQRGLVGVRHAASLGICFLLRGAQSYRVDGQPCELQGGDQLLTFPDECLDTGGTPEGKGHLHWMLIRMQPLDAPLLFLEKPAAAALRRALLAMPARHFPGLPGTGELVSSILNTLVRRPGTLLDRLAAASLVLRYLLATRQASRQESAAVVSPRIQRSLEYIEARVSDAFNVPDLARHIGLSESRFKARFRREVGLPPGEYIARVKIAAACEALPQPGCRVTELAHALGFSSSQYFATVFRRFTGMTPSAFQASRSGRDP